MPGTLCQFVFLLCTLAASWFGMQAVHEAGHIVGAWLTGGTVENVVLHPLTISRTDVSPNPRPLLVVWAGPLVGVVLPLLGWWLAAALKWEQAFLLRFFAGFCLIANGLYLGAGSFDGVGDCGDMLRHGSPVWLLWLFGIVCTPLGLALWHGQAKHFGLGKDAPRVTNRTVAVSLLTLATLLTIGVVLGK